jgi:hypothetical protein
MFTWILYFPPQHKEMIEKSIPYMLEQAFVDWYFKPKITITDSPCITDDEIRIKLEYENPDHKNQEQEEGAEVIAVVDAFIGGMIYASEISTGLGKDKVDGKGRT